MCIYQNAFYIVVLLNMRVLCS